MNKTDADSVKQAVGCPMSRRKFLHCLAAAGALAAVPGGLLKPFDAKAEKIVFEGDYQVFRNACPRNCYDTCSIKSYVKDGVLQFIEGAPESTFTRGGTCVKGYAYTRRPYSPDRIKYPMIQDGRGSGPAGTDARSNPHGTSRMALESVLPKASWKRVAA